MATSIFKASDQNRNNLLLWEDYHAAAKQDEQTSRPRRTSSKAVETHKKTTPQRGMGVEKLERLRIQERWKKMTEINYNKTGPSLPYAFVPTAFADPGAMSPVPMPFPRFGGSGLGLHGAGGGSNSIQPRFRAHDMGASGGAFFPDEIFGGYLWGVDNVKGDSKELPSIPNLLRCDHCADCYKGAKVVAIHRKGRKGRGNVLMEYEFFPGGNAAGRITTHNELMLMMKLGGARSGDAMDMGMGGGGEASCVTTTTATATGADDASTCIDLSLNLSY